jgi:hypothetical protein
MTKLFSNEQIEAQKQKVFAENPSVNLVAPCKIGEGILRLSQEERERLISLYSAQNVPISFFIPASGSGSRMFEFLYEFLEEPNDENRSKVERFLNMIADFAFFKQFPKEMQRSIIDQTVELDEIVNFLLGKEGLGFGHMPKGLIPFHSNSPFILNPFQEQIIQGAQLENDDFSFHFTVQSTYENEIRNGIKHVEGLTGEAYNVSFSEQAVSSNSIAFLENGDVYYSENGEAVTRPAGHGALLSHLNKLNSDVIFIKNIDNVQHYNNSQKTLVTWKVLGGLLLEFKNKAAQLKKVPTLEGLKELNAEFQVYSDSEILSCTTNEDIRHLLDRPVRVCGMVKNEGQPGGGPFWINENGIISKQIVEKAQISMKGDQYKLMVQSTHFNPVMIAASPLSLEGEKFDLEKFKDDSKYFIVRKRHHGQSIRYMELPGLWNGSMANWNTIFVEIPSSTFSPVKTVLDLLDDAHKG